MGYQTAYLKVYYPVEFMAALITSVMGNTAKVAHYIQDCKRMGIEVLQPDMNKSFSKFTVEGNKIRFGLAAVKNVGANMIDSIVRAREDKGYFTSFTDFCQKVESKDLNKRAVECLIKCGAFDGLKLYRSQLMAIYEKVMDSVYQDKKKNIEGQIGLFEMDEGNSLSFKHDVAPNIKEFNDKIRLGMEKEVLGLYISGHPLAEFQQELKYYTTASSKDLLEIADNPTESKFKDREQVKVAGMIVDKVTKTTRNNELMAFITIEDLFGTMECIVFPRALSRYNPLLVEDGFVIIEGMLNIKDEEQPKILVNKVNLLTQIEKSKLYIKIKKGKDLNLLKRSEGIFKKHHGNVPVYVYIEKENKKLRADRDLWVNLKGSVIEELEEIFGKECIKVKSE